MNYENWHIIITIFLFLGFPFPTKSTELKSFKALCKFEGFTQPSEEFGECVLEKVKNARLDMLYDQSISDQIKRLENAARSKFGSDYATQIPPNLIVGIGAAVVTHGVVQGINNLASPPRSLPSSNCTMNCSPPSVIDLQNYGVLPTPQAIGNVSVGIR